MFRIYALSNPPAFRAAFSRRQTDENSNKTVTSLAVSWSTSGHAGECVHDAADGAAPSKKW
ncbi:MAG: hypothetical protein DMF00_00670 [Verrucomicrobia bacterium]|nr:MAG: hypothetical protein DMF00_00670 [Verrucomicrobiota bacterium]